MSKLSEVFEAYERRRQEILADGGGDLLKESDAREKRKMSAAERRVSHVSNRHQSGRVPDADSDRDTGPEAEPDADDFGDEPEDFGGKNMTYVSPDDEGGEFRGAPADPILAPGFGDEPDGADFGGEPVFGDVPEPSADPEDALWHGNIGWEDDETGSSGGEHRTSVKFPDYEGPKHRSAHHPEDEPDEKGFYPRSRSSKKR